MSAVSDFLFAFLIGAPVVWFYLSRRYTARCTCGHWASAHPGSAAECRREVYHRNAAGQRYTARCDCRAWVQAQQARAGLRRGRAGASS